LLDERACGVDLFARRQQFAVVFKGISDGLFNRQAGLWIEVFRK